MSGGQVTQAAAQGSPAFPFAIRDIAYNPFAHLASDIIITERRPPVKGVCGSSMIMTLGLLSLALPLGEELVWGKVAEGRSAEEFV